MASKFLVVECSECGNKQTIFSKAASVVKCSKCGSVLAEPGASKVRVKAKVLKVVE